MNKLEQGRIPGQQLTSLLIGFLLGTAIVIIPGSEVGQDHWISLIIGFAEGLVFAWLYICLAARYPGQTLIEINDKVFGPILGRLISLLYIWFFMHIAALVLRDFGDFFITIVYPETPMPVILIMLTLLCASAVRNGIEVIARCSLLLVPIALMTVLVTAGLLLPEMDFSNLLPLLDKPLPAILWSGHIIATFPYGESVVFLMILAFLQKPAQGRTSYISAFTVVLLFFLMVSIRNTAVLGLQASNTVYPSYEVTRMISIAEILTRLEVLLAATYLFMGFLKLSVLYYAASLGLAQLLSLRSYLPLVLPLGSLLISLSILQIESTMENAFFTARISPINKLPYEVFLPCLTLAVSRLRGHSLKGGKK